MRTAEILALVADTLPEAVVEAGGQTGGGCRATFVTRLGRRGEKIVGYLMLTDSGGTTDPGASPTDTEIMVGYYLPDGAVIGYAESTFGDGFATEFADVLRSWWAGTPIVEIVGDVYPDGSLR